MSLLRLTPFGSGFVQSPLYRTRSLAGCLWNARIQMLSLPLTRASRIISTAQTGCGLSSTPGRSSSYLVEGPIEEATLPTYRADLFHPTHPGQILNSKYRIISKLGYGAYSTVWLAENLSWYALFFLPITWIGMFDLIIDRSSFLMS